MEHPQRLFARGILAAAVLYFPASRAIADADPIQSETSWTLAVLPDTQHYVDNEDNYPHFVAQTQWIKDHADSHNIAFVLHEGDLVQDNDATPGPDNLDQWGNARAALDLLHDANPALSIPYAMSPGNHDYGPNGDSSVRETEFSDLDKFGPGTPYATQPTVGGFFEPTRTENSFHKFNAGGQDWLVLSLEFGPRDEVVAWANQVVEENLDHQVMLVTHGYLKADNTRLDASSSPVSSANPHNYGIASGPGGVNDGQELWDDLISQHDTFRFVFSGHVIGTGYLASVGENGIVVDQILANYQAEQNGGNGYMRLLEFQADGAVQVRTYSPSLDMHRRSANEQFTIVHSLNGIDGDLNQDGTIDVEDWLLFESNNLADLSGFSFLQQYARGDLDADGDNDASDFVLFRQYYNAAHGQGAFAAIGSHKIPEPSSLLLTSCLVGGMLLTRLHRQSPTSLQLASLLGTVLFAGVLFVGAAHSKAAEPAGPLLETAPQPPAPLNSGPYLATGVRVGEVTSNSAVLWTRLSKNPQPNRDGFDLREASWRTNVKVAKDLSTLWGSCPGSQGQVRLRYGLTPQLANAVTTEWHEVTESVDFTHQFAIQKLSPNSVYHYVVETAKPGNQQVQAKFAGKFTTAPSIDTPKRVLFTVVTGQGHRDLTNDSGYQIYPSMAELKPDFMVPTGDAVYLDSEWPRASSVELANYHWQRAGSLPRHVEFWRQTPGYWLKDDHDTYTDDCWPTLRVAKSDPFTFAEGVQIFRNQTPSSEKPYRTFRWGRDLQIWLVEAREYRMPNNMPDGANKTLWGKEQLAWFKKTVSESTATWKVLLSPTPIIGPSRKGKFDNHSSAFEHEGNEIRRWIAEHEPQRMFVVCGDIHFQYHSVHPETQVQEFSCGPASDEHAGGSTGKKPEHQFHRVAGGFLSVAIDSTDQTSEIQFALHAVDGEPIYNYSQKTRCNTQE